MSSLAGLAAGASFVSFLVPPAALLWSTAWVALWLNSGPLFSPRLSACQPRALPQRRRQDTAGSAGRARGGVLHAFEGGGRRRSPLLGPARSTPRCALRAGPPPSTARSRSIAQAA
eukprot:6612753-Pyramimonas_sp.AAC.1